MNTCFRTEASSVQLSFHHLTEKNGLTPADRYTISKDSKGYIWIGSEDGLLRFDGRQIEKYQHETENPNSLSENIITSQCFEDTEGNLWFTTFGAVNCYLRQTDDFLTFSLPKKVRNYHGFHFDVQGKFWLRIGSGTKGALYIFDIISHTFEQSLPLEGESCTVIKNKEGKVIQLLSTFLPDKPGLVWEDLETGDKKEVEFLFTTTGRKRSFSSPVKGVFPDIDNRVWVGVYNGLGGYQLGASEGIIHSKRNIDIDQDIGWVWAITEYDENQLIIAADNGLLLFDKDTGTFVQQFRYNAADPYSLALKNLNNLYFDPEGNIWLSGSQQEIAFAHLAKNRFPYLKETAGTFITTIAEDHEGNIWCSSLDSGTYVYNQNRALLFRSTKLKNPTSPEKYTDLTQLYFFIKNNTNQWWGNLQNTYLLWNPSSKEFEFSMNYFLGVSSMASNQINYNYQLSDGKNIIAKGNNIYELKLSEEKADSIPWHNIQYLQLGTINIIFEDQKGYIYLGDNQGRLVTLKEQNNRISKAADTKGTGIIYAFQEDHKRNILWLATSKGLGKIHPNFFDFTLLNEKADQIPSEPFYNIVLDKEGQLWLAGNNGLVRFDPDTASFHRFGIADGLLSPVFNKNACITASQSGEIWVGGKNGVNVFRPEAVSLLDLKPSVQLSRFLVNDEVYQTENNLNETSNFTFEYAQNTLSFEFVALDYSDPISNRFVCQMEGYDPDPVDNGSRNFIRYANLPAGNYDFKVWASNSDGILNETPLELGIKIIPPFYQTWWFYLLCLIVISSIIYIIFRYRLEQALKVERLRVKISSDLHDDVGGILSGLSMQSEILELTASDDAKPKLARIAELSRSAMSRMRDTVWAIDARKDKLENLLDRMHEHAEETLSPKNIGYNITHQNLDLKSNVPTDIRQNLYLIYKEAITNTAKHSNGDKVLITLKKADHSFEMNIHDNGKVEVKRYKTTGLGVSNMKMRAKQINATLETSIEDGYRIWLRMKSFV